MARAKANGIEIEYEVYGDPAGRPLLLVRGLGTQLIHWPPEFCEGLVAAGHRVVIFDNRDVGLSTHLHGSPPTSLAGAIRDVANGVEPKVPYLLSNMADDVLGLMDVLGFDSVHLAGNSMGGMIVQQTAIQAPERIRSLVSIMSTTGEPGLARPKPEAAAALMTPPPRERAAYIEHSVKTARAIGSPGFPFDEEGWRDLAGRTFDRAFDPAGVARQLLAVTASGSRAEALARLRVPTLVIHGADDPLVPLAGGEATARAVPGARLHVIPGMGHDLPRETWAPITEAIAAHTKQANEIAA